MTLEQWAAVGQIAGAVFTLVGVLIALYVALKAIREVQTDRRLNKTPYLAFEPGGSRYPIEFKEVSDELKKEDELPKDAAFVGLKTDEGEVTFKYGNLRNYGPGPAIHAKITWIPEEIWLGSEKFRLDRDKLSEVKYSKELNTIPASPGHILPNQTSEFFRLPAFINRDFEKKVTKVTGVIEITCFDLFKQPHTTRQRFYLFTGYNDDPAHIHFTFSDIET